jgi:hypothetical protein
MRIYAAVAQKERELISKRTRAALAEAKARGVVLGGDRRYRPACGPDAAAAAQARQLVAEQGAYRLAIEVERLPAEAVVGQAAMARALNERGVPAPSGRGAWTRGGPKGDGKGSCLTAPVNIPSPCRSPARDHCRPRSS